MTEVWESGLNRVKMPAASGGAFRAGGHSADMARSASTCPSKEAVCSVGGICPPNPLTRMPFLPTASRGATWHDCANILESCCSRQDQNIPHATQLSGKE